MIFILSFINFTNNTFISIFFFNAPNLETFYWVPLWKNNLENVHNSNTQNINYLLLLRYSLLDWVSNEYKHLTLTQWSFSYLSLEFATKCICKFFLILFLLLIVFYFSPDEKVHKKKNMVISNISNNFVKYPWSWCGLNVMGVTFISVKPVAQFLLF